MLWCGGGPEAAGGIQALEFVEDEAAVEVHVAADAEEGDAPVIDVEGFEVRAGEDGRLAARGVVDAAEGEIPGYAPAVGGEGVPVEDYVVGDLGCHCGGESC